VICTSCTAENREDARFCDSCGAPLAAAPARQQRKVVTVLFCDVTGSTALGESLDPEALRAVMTRYFEVARDAIERHGGTVEKFIGDAVMAVFGVPTIREDDALRAVRAAAELRSAVEIDVRIGVNTGEVVTGSGDSLVTGDAVNVAARLEQAAAPGEVLIGDRTYRLVRGAVEAELLPPLLAKGKSQPLTAHRLVAMTGDASFARRLDAPLVGRDRERRLLEDAWERCRSERACALFTVLGTAGVGKSRLVAEFLAGVDGATVVRGACLSYGEGITYWPVVEVVKQLLGDVAAPNAAIAALLGEGDVPADEIAFAVRKLFEQVSAEHPLVVYFDDVQWGEPTFLDLIEHVSDWSREAPILIVCLARPDLLDLRPSWGGGKLNATTVLLEPLTETETDELIVRLLGELELAPSLRERIRDAAGGNPLYVEQMLALVHETGAIEVVVPPTIQALLAARLDQLPAQERSALERGAVEGQVFHRGAVQALAPDETGVPTNLMRLVRKELVRPTAAILPGDDAFRFRHLLIRDAAYDALPKATRAELHERFAVWIEVHAPDLVELDKILGYHFEQAALYRAELGRSEPELEACAAARLGAAGTRAVARADVGAARSLLQRAVNLLPMEAPERFPLLVELGRMLYLSRELDAADEALSAAVDHGDADTSARAFFLRAFIRGHATPDLSLQEAEHEVRETLSRLEDGTVGDRTLAEGYVTLGELLFWNGRTSASMDAGQRALLHAQRAGESALESRAHEVVGGAMFFGTATWAELEAHARSVLDNVALGARSRRALAGLAAAAAHQGRFDEARSLQAQVDAGLEERGESFALASGKQGKGLLELLAGDLPAAERILREGWNELGEIGERGYRSTTGALLAQVLALLGRYEEALAIAAEAEVLTSADDWVTKADALCARAYVASGRTDHEAAVTYARRATELADEYEYVLTRTHFWLARGEILVAAGLLGEAREALAEAIRLSRIKGAGVHEERANAILDALPVPG
jgi:class 3 adenylate cyclase/tetratricopeptide (TPR) repeat protein